MEQPAYIKVSGALEGEFILIEERSASEFVIVRDTSWNAMLDRASGTRLRMRSQTWRPRMAFLPVDGDRH